MRAFGIRIRGRGEFGPYAALLALSTLLLGAPVARAALVELTGPAPAGLESAGFELERPATVRIEAQGLELDRSRRDVDAKGWTLRWGESLFGGHDDDESLGCYAWILDARTREPVWKMDLDETDRGDGPGLRVERAEVELPAGRYEVYLWGGHQQLVALSEGDWNRRSLERELQDVQEELRACYVRVDSEGTSGRTFEPTGRFDDALVAFNALGDDQLVRQAFEITRETELRVYGLMEYPRSADEPVDFGWIIDTSTGRRVWDMSDRRGRNAGGASKNRVLDRELTLEPGRYLLVYGTDGSHSAARFNADPPYDPLGWGVQLLPGEGFDRGAFRLVDTPARGDAVVDFSRARDDEFFEQAFRLARPTELHVYAVGEGIDDGWTWVDYGWIIDASSRQTVWEMSSRNTFPAGGAEKNLMFDGVVSLPAGDYVAFYVTDDSHAWGDWNAGAPFDPDAWGLQIFAENPRDVQLIASDQIDRGADVLVDITRVRDDETRRERFTLDRTTTLEIHAVGEGVRGEMVDFGYLREVETRRIVWEMEYRDTDHAGGADKNRQVDARVTLEAGEYEAVYETDDSHAFGAWNDNRPDDPLSWGMVVRIAR